MKILATDLDRTLLPNGRWKADDQAIELFNDLTEKHGVLVRNADDQLVQNVRKAMDENPALKVYFARGGFNGLAGYYTSGVIEGAYHYGVFDEG